MGVEVALVVAGVAVALLVDEVAGVVVSFNEILTQNLSKNYVKSKFFFLNHTVNRFQEIFSLIVHNMKNTVWKFQNFSVIPMLREINFEET